MIALALAALVWTAHPSDGVTMTLTREGAATRLDFDFHGHGGYAIARANVALELPPNYQFVMPVRGETAPQDLELKLIDASGENVWWLNRRNFTFPREWTTLRTKKRQIEFAWGPATDRTLRRVAAMEVVVTAGSGGKGTGWFEDPLLEALPPTPTEDVRINGPVATFDAKREVGGLTIEWKTQPSAFTVHVDGTATAHRDTRFVWLPDAEAKSIRIEGG
ncbi:MAG TPA: hypothetical protein VEU30_12840, partial [Thermoanaerobaculia bacterium]|nr:hypothetical protein [Thermoanaerobaculia bacterium]